MNFELKLHFNAEFASTVKWSGPAYYTQADDNNQAHFDYMDISDGIILITGHRSSAVGLEQILFNPSSTLYFQIIKALSFYYLCSGSPITLCKMELLSDIGSTETETDFLQPFKKKLEAHQIMTVSQMQKLFLFERKVQLFLTSLTYYIKATQDSSFELYWRSFNSLYSIISPSDKDFDKLCNIRLFVEQNRINFSSTLTYISSDTAQDIRKLRIREYILNNWPSTSLNQTKSYVETIKRFSDMRIISVFKDTLPYRIDAVKKHGLDGDINHHIAQCQALNQTDDVELLCFYVLKYAYFIRNKYFHAEKAQPFFILKKTSETEEMAKISSIFEYFLADLIRCNVLYL